MASLLTGGRTSRLVGRLVVRDRWAASVNAGLQPGSRYPRLFTFTATPIAPRTTQELEGAIYEEIERLQREPPTDYELQRIRNQVERSNYARIEDGFGLAIQMASSEALWNDWAQTFRDQGAILAVTAADVQRVARTYFARGNRTVATLVRPAQGAGTRGTD
jgi:YD repeat-containing protein